MINSTLKLSKIIAPLVCGIGLTIGSNIPASAYPDNSRIYSDYNNYHRQTFRDIQPFRSLNVTPRYYIPLPPSNYHPKSYYYDRKYDNHDYNRDHHHNSRQRRAIRRGYRQPTHNNDSRNYIRIRVR